MHVVGGIIQYRLIIEMWYMSAWIDKGVGVIKGLNIIWEGMLRWRRCKLMRYVFSR